MLISRNVEMKLQETLNIAGGKNTVAYGRETNPGHRAHKAVILNVMWQRQGNRSNSECAYLCRD